MTAISQVKKIKSLLVAVIKSSDNVLFVLGSITELYGEEGCGKSQFLLHLIAQCVSPLTWRGVAVGGLEISVVLFDFDYQFCSLRMVGKY